MYFSSVNKFLVSKETVVLRPLENETWKNLVLSNPLIMVELVPSCKPDLESWQFAVTKLTLETKRHLPKLYGGNSTFINSFDKTKLSYFSFQLANTKTLEIKWSWVNRFLYMPWFPTCFVYKRTFQSSRFTSSFKFSVPVKFPRSRFCIHLLNQ